MWLREWMSHFTRYRIWRLTQSIGLQLERLLWKVKEEWAFLFSDGQLRLVILINNYWMGLSMIWRIMKIEEGVIHRGRGCYPPRTKTWLDSILSNSSFSSSHSRELFAMFLKFCTHARRCLGWRHSWRICNIKSLTSEWLTSIIVYHNYFPNLFIASWLWRISWRIKANRKGEIFRMNNTIN